MKFAPYDAEMLSLSLGDLMCTLLRIISRKNIGSLLTENLNLVMEPQEKSLYEKASLAGHT